MSGLLKALLWILLLPFKIIMLPFTLVGIIQKVFIGLLIVVVVALVVIVAMNLPS